MECRLYKLITFDITGTIFKYRTSPAEEYWTVLLKHGVQVKKPIIKDLINKNMYEMTKKHPNFGLKTGLGWENYWKSFAHNVISDTLCKQNIFIHNKKLTNIIDDLMQTYSTGDTFVLQNGVISLLQYLKSKQIPLGIISNYDPRIKDIIKNHRLENYFSFILSSYEVGFAKPSVEIFQKAESFVKDYSDKKLFLHVGDSYTLDYVAAKNAGWSAFLVHTDKQNITQQNPELDNFIFDDFTALKRFFTSTNSVCHQ
ncbi:rhythmically expressed gene 2 protein-like [Daktulosphaira vitifoliae]|uniref:rhythmically expressed gene 2 protein-like n=1 Tax=Daktulosphaira vitifoliae TaxID=58002 RepID=UPI0021AAF2A6|nr:rhythmically expressed gene 2 protein-like [Daktulosphaira vitifoliae]